MRDRKRGPACGTLALLTAVLMFAGGAHGGWLAGWDYRQEISVNPSVTPGDLTDFPLLVKITDPANEVFGKAAFTTGTDIAFTAGDGVSLVAHEIEHFHQTGTKELDAWVKTNVSSTTPTKLYMYYGNPDGLDHQDMEQTWDASYKMVQHLQEDAAAAGCHIDSTANPNNGTPYRGSTITNLHTDAGKIGGACDFGGSDTQNDRVYCGNNATLSTPTDGTISFWVNPDGRGTFSGNNQEGKVGLAGNRPLVYGVGRIQVHWSGATKGGNPASYPGLYALPDNQWTHAAVSWTNAGSGADDGTIYWYKDGQLVKTVTGLNLPKGGPYCEIGRYGSVSPLNGRMDEVRLSDTARDADWAKASFNNQDDPSAHQTAAPAEQKGAWLDGWDYRQPITISKEATKEATNADLTDFPLLVQIKGVVNDVFAHAAGQDIVFTNGDGVTLLDREVEYFSTVGSPELAAWVSTDLSASEDTLIYMYYGGPDRPNATDTWDPNFRMVQHLQETSGTVLDSTKYGNNGTPYNGVTQNAAGLIGGGDAFNGIASGQYIAIPDSNFGIAGGDPFTMEAWCNVYDDGVSTHNQYILSKYGRIGVRVLAGGTPSLGLYVEGGGGWGGGPDIMGDWHHMTVVYDPDLGKIFHYLDGDLIREMTQATPMKDGSSYYIATWATTYGWVPGILDEVRISDIARDAHWVRANYRLQVSELGHLDFGAEQIPEPTTMALLALGALALLRRRRRRA